MATGQRPTNSKFDTFNRFVDFAAPSLKPAEFRVWVFLWRISGRTCEAKCHISYIGQRTGVTGRHVKDAIRGLIDAKCLKVQKGTNWHRSSFKLDVCKETYGNDLTALRVHH